jgi:hypothetical protein
MQVPEPERNLLDQERNEERQKRVQTEGMLHILGQAIGGMALTWKFALMK